MSASPFLRLSPADQTRVSHHAFAFRVWREAEAAKWECTVSDLAEATGEAPELIRDLAIDRKWPISDEPPSEESFL